MNNTYLIQFSSENCPSCFMLEQEAHKAVKKFENLTFVNFQDEATINAYKDKFNLHKLPALLLIQDNELLGILYGSQPEEILISWLNAKLKGESK